MNFENDTTEGKPSEAIQGQDNEFNLNDIFTYDKDRQADEDEEDLKDFGRFDFNNEATQADEEDEEEIPGGEGEEEDLFGEAAPAGQEAAAEEEEEFTDADLALFNKKLNKDFADVEELKKFLGEGDQKETEKSSANDLETAQNVIDYLSPLLDRSKTSDEDLLRREFETIATNSGQDIADEDVQYEIDEKIEKLRDTNQIDLRAQVLRNDLLKVYNEHKGKKDKIEAEKVAQAAAQTVAEKAAVQNAFAEIARRDTFFGIKPEKNVIREAYQRVNSGEFLKKLQSDKNALAKLAVIDAYEKEIHKKASSGLTYSDGIKAVRDEFNGVKEQNSGSILANAQKRGSAVSPSGHSALISSLTK